MAHKYLSKISVRQKDSHKGDYGRVFVLAGSRGMTGAAFLCSQGVLFSGSGLVINGIPKSLNQIMETKLTEVMTLPLPETKNGELSVEAKKEILDFSKKCDAAVIGPGLGRGAEVCKLVKELIKHLEIPLILDADGINALDGKIDFLKKRKGRIVITPHPGEMARLMGKGISEVQADRTETAKEAAKLSGSIVCLKGHATVVADPDGNVYINKTGNSGMATGGSGDVLTGMIASFIGQGIDDFSSAVTGVYLHGLAGDIAADKKGQFSMTASDILTCLPEAFKKAGI
ncbi:MAG: NAD(P)H-hydrate dehydratase [Candidatus Omnitrophota bacterium]